MPEARLGDVEMGQEVVVEVDAFPDDAFEGTVTHVAHEAQFTPRNVQTSDERANLVFAVTITLDNHDRKLRPGMPADALLTSGRSGVSPLQPKSRAIVARLVGSSAARRPVWLRRRRGRSPRAGSYPPSSERVRRQVPGATAAKASSRIRRLAGSCSLASAAVASAIQRSSRLATRARMA